MRTLTVCVALAILCVVHAIRGNWGGRFGGRVDKPEDPRNGSPCTPQYPLRKCGQQRLVDEVSEPVDNCGPNVCRFKRIYEVRTYSYEYRQYCSSWGKCRSVCSCTNVCSDEVRNITKQILECCEGFAIRIPEDPWERHHRSRLSILRTEGCSQSICPTSSTTDPAATTVPAVTTADPAVTTADPAGTGSGGNTGNVDGDNENATDPPSVMPIDG